MVGMPGLEPGNPEGADLQSAAVAAVPHPLMPLSIIFAGLVLAKQKNVMTGVYLDNYGGV